MEKAFPLRPNLEQYRKQAKDLLKQAKAGESEALARFERHRPRPEGVHLADAQLVIAREHGLPSWSKFKRALELMPEFKQALYPGDFKTVERILEECPELMDCNPWEGWEGYRPIQGVTYGCVWHRPEQTRIVKLLIEKGAEHDIFLAARGGQVERVREMIEQDPSLVHARNQKGATPLYLAGCVYGTFPEGEQVVHLLREHGAEMDFFVACTFGWIDEVNQMLDADPSLAMTTDPEGMTALHWVVRPRRNAASPDDSVKITKRLLELGVDVHATNPQEEGMTALHHCGEWSAYAQQVDLILEAGGDLHAKTPNGWTPLDYAIDRERKGMIKSLKARGAVSGCQPSLE